MPHHIRGVSVELSDGVSVFRDVVCEVIRPVAHLEDHEATEIEELSLITEITFPNPIEKSTKAKLICVTI